MNCTELREQLYDYADGLMDAQDAAAVEAHLSSCDGCAEELENIRHYLGNMQTMEKAAAPAGFLQGVRERIERKSWLARLSGSFLGLISRPSFLKLAGAGAMLTLVVSIYISVHQPLEYMLPEKSVSEDSKGIIREEQAVPSISSPEEKAEKTSADEMAAEAPAESPKAAPPPLEPVRVMKRKEPGRRPEKARTKSLPQPEKVRPSPAAGADQPESRPALKPAAEKASEASSGISDLKSAGGSALSREEPVLEALSADDMDSRAPSSAPASAPSPAVEKQKLFSKRSARKTMPEGEPRRSERPGRHIVPDETLPESPQDDEASKSDADKSAAKPYKLSEQEVSGWLDNPSAVYILDESGLQTDALPVNPPRGSEREALESDQHQPEWTTLVFSSSVISSSKKEDKARSPASDRDAEIESQAAPAEKEIDGLGEVRSSDMDDISSFIRSKGGTVEKESRRGEHIILSIHLPRERYSDLLKYLREIQGMVLKNPESAPSGKGLLNLNLQFPAE